MTTQSPLLTLAAGFVLGAATTLYCRKTQQIRRSIPEWISNYRRQPDGSITPDDLRDGVMEDSFPASDPPPVGGNRFT